MTKPKAKTSSRLAAANQSTRQIAKDAVRGGSKSEKKNRRAGAGRGQKG
jgi:hypothetical protein